MGPVARVVRVVWYRWYGVGTEWVRCRYSSYHNYNSIELWNITICDHLWFLIFIWLNIEVHVMYITHTHTHTHIHMKRTFLAKFALKTDHTLYSLQQNKLQSEISSSWGRIFILLLTTKPVNAIFWIIQQITFAYVWSRN